MSKTKGYYDIIIDISDLLENATVEEAFFLQDLRQRKLFLEAEVSVDNVFHIVKNIMQYNAEDKDIPVEERRPILLYIASPGGSVDAGYQVIDVIKNSITPVYTINIGYWYSMGFLIGISGHKRFALPNSKLLLHDGSNFVYDSGAKVQDRLEFSKREEERTKKFVLENTNISEEEYDNNYRVEWYMFADEAKEKGCIDYIIGVDCSMDEVV